MLAARLVGPSGEVVGVERDAHSISRASARASEAGLSNVRFIESDVAQIPSENLFDAAVGRFILQFLPDPAAVLRSLSRLVRPGGIIAFQENSFAPFVLLSAHLPLWSAGVAAIHETGRRAGIVNMELGTQLHKVFKDAGLPAPHMHLDVPLGNDPDFTRWVSDSLRSLLPLAKKFDVPIEQLGDLDTLQERLQEEVAGSNTVVPWLGLVGAWCRMPAGAPSA